MVTHGTPLDRRLFGTREWQGAQVANALTHGSSCDRDRRYNQGRKLSYNTKPYLLSAIYHVVVVATTNDVRESERAPVVPPSDSSVSRRLPWLQTLRWGA
mgnify:CR=1 FL=1